ncbi:MAG: glycoside hydrolase family 97 catalytic domain-containing protein [Thermoplasmatota archaeon]
MEDPTQKWIDEAMLPIAVSSPDESIVLELDLKDIGLEKDCIIYTLTIDDELIVNASRLGLVFDDGSTIGSGMALGSVILSRSRSNYSLPFGYMDSYPDNYDQAVISFNETSPSNRTLELTVRVYNEGISIRYSMPKQIKTVVYRIKGELTQFSFDEDFKGYTEYGTEGEYKWEKLSNVKSKCEVPFTMDVENGIYLSISEAALDDYSRMYVSCQSGGRPTLKVQLESRATRSTPFSTPWRVILVGRGIEDLSENSHIIYSMCPSSEIGNISWIKPGKAFRDCYLRTDTGKQTIDFCVEHNMQYVHFDAGWYGDEHSTGSDATTIAKKDLNLTEVIRYGREKGVGVVLYVNEKALTRQWSQLFPLYEQWGVAGVKFGFVDGRTQSGINNIHKWVRLAAKHHLIVDIHDNYRPTGMSRTFPNLLTVEGVRGNEHHPGAAHNVVLPFTRCLAGPADYTPTFYVKEQRTTLAHQLALPVIYQSSMHYLYWYSGVSTTDGRPECEFWDKMPTVWNETICLDSRLGSTAVVARRTGDQWLVGAITGSSANTFKIPLDFLGSGRSYIATIFMDGPNRTVSIDKVGVSSDTMVIETAPPKGGICLHIRPVMSGEQGLPPLYPPRLLEFSSWSVMEDTPSQRTILYPNGHDVSWSMHPPFTAVQMDPIKGILYCDAGNDDVGSHTVNLSIFASGELVKEIGIDIDVQNVNDPPVMGELPTLLICHKGQISYIENHATDMDPTNDKLVWDVESPISGISINSTSGNMTIAPFNCETGSYTLRVSVDDQNGGSDSDEMVLSVTENGEFLIITTRFKELITLEDQLIVLDMECWSNSADLENVKWSILEGPEFLNIRSNTGELFGIPKQEDVGRFNVAVAVQDDNGLFDRMDFSVVVKEVNDPPDLRPVPSLHFISPGEQFSLQLEADDVDGSHFIWSLPEKPDFIDIDPISGLVLAMPTEDDIGIHKVVARVEDDGGASDGIAFFLIVKGEDKDVVIIDPSSGQTVINITLPKWNISLDGIDAVELENITQNLYVIYVPVDDDDDDGDGSVLPPGDADIPAGESGGGTDRTDMLLALVFFGLILLSASVFIRRKGTVA